MPIDRNKNADDLKGLPPESQLEKVLASRWDAGKLSNFLKKSKASKGEGLSFGDKARFEKRLGVDLSGVRIMTGELAEEITRAHNAEALTVGDSGIILVRQSTRFTPGTPEYASLLAHELTHVAQAQSNMVSAKSVGGSMHDGGEAREHSEAEAEQHEGDVLREEKGETRQAKDRGSAEERRQKIIARVHELIEQEKQLAKLRSGHY